MCQEFDHRPFHVSHVIKPMNVHLDIRKSQQLIALMMLKWAPMNHASLLSILVSLTHLSMNHELWSLIFYANSDEDWTERGCTLDVHENVEKYAVVCTKSGCNTENVIHSHCVHCESHARGLCSVISNPDNLSKQCTGIYSFEDRGCYTLRKSMSFSVFVHCF